MIQSMRTVALAALLVILGGSSVLSAQTSGRLKEFYESLVNGGVAPLEQAYAALDWIALENPQVQGQQRTMLLLVQAHASAAVGQLGGAERALAELKSASVDTQETRRARLLVAVAAGDAATQLSLIDLLLKDAAGDERQQLGRLRADAKRIGEKAPGVKIPVPNEEDVRPAARAETPLLVDFWNLKKAPDEKLIAALQALHAELKDAAFFEMVSVNGDGGDAALKKAQDFAKEKGYVWKKRFEGRTTRSPIRDDAFKTRDEPHHFLIDGRGFIRAIGRATEPGFVYAVRAAVAEASGDAAYRSPINAQGEPSVPPPQAAASGGRKPSGDGGAGGELESNPEAASKLIMARTYLRQRLFRKAREAFEAIVRDYPNTKEAKEAAEYLEGLPNTP